MAHATYDPGNPYGPMPARPRLRGWVLGVPLLLGLAWAGYTLLSREHTSSAVPVEENTSAWRPSWQPATYTQEPPPAPPAQKPDRTEAYFTRGRDNAWIMAVCRSENAGGADIT